MKCGCASCSAGLTCYRADRDVVLPAGTKRQALWGELLELVAQLRDEAVEVREALNQRAPFELFGVRWMPTQYGRNPKSPRTDPKGSFTVAVSRSGGSLPTLRTAYRRFQCLPVSDTSSGAGPLPVP